MGKTQRRSRRSINAVILLVLALLMQSIQFISSISVTPWAPYVALSLALGVMIASVELSGPKTAVLIGMACPVLCWIQGVYQISTMLFTMLGNTILVIGLWEFRDFSIRGRLTSFLLLALTRFMILSLGMACMMVFLTDQSWLSSIYTAVLTMRAQGFGSLIAAVVAYIWLRVAGVSE